MQRLSAARRLRAGAVDRQVAIGALLLSAILVLSAVPFARAPLPEILVRDPAAARELVGLMRAGERGRWIVTFDSTRTLAGGQTRRQRVEEGRSSSLHVVISGTAMTIERGDRLYECDVVGDGSGCKESTDGAALPASEVLRVVVATGAYNVVRQPNMTVAGQRARCFRVRATGHGSLPHLGVEANYCFAADGISLLMRVVRPPGNVDEQVATSVRRRASVRDIEAMARTFARRPASSQR